MTYLGFTIIKYFLTWSNSMHNLIFKKENNFQLIYNLKKYLNFEMFGALLIILLEFTVIFIEFPWTDANLHAFFREQTTEKNYVFLTKLENGPKKLCTSNVGKIGGKQEIILNKKCYDYGSILHEIFHSFGFPHENQRSDFKDYIKSQ